MSKLLCLLPDNIAGRLIINSLIEGFKHYKIELEVIDKLTTNFNYYNLDKSQFSYLISHDYSALELNYQLKLNIPTINYFSNTLGRNLSYRGRNKYFDQLCNPKNYFFYWDKVLTERSKNKIPNISYMPLFVNTSIYKNIKIKKDYDIMFAGSIAHGKRLKTLQYIINSFSKLNIAIFSYPEHYLQAIEHLNSKEKTNFKACYKGFITDENAMTKEINKSKIVINFTTQGISNLNLRVYEVLACETFLITDFRAEILDLFTPEEDIIYYKNLKDLCNIIETYLKQPEQYAHIIKAGRTTIENKYSNKIAAGKILEKIGLIK